MSNPPIPLYYTIKEELIKQIENEEVKPDEAVPSEAQIMKTFNVSRTTARKAVETLLNEGYVYIVRGKGTFVKGKKFSQGILALTSCTEMLREKGFNPEVRVLSGKIVTPSKKIQTRMGLSERDKVFNLERVNYVENVPMNFTNSYLAYKYAEGIEKYDFSSCSVYESLKNIYGIEILDAYRTVEAVLPGKEVARILEIGEESPILKFDAIVYGRQNGKEIIIESYNTYFRSDRSKFEINKGPRMKE